MGLGNIKKKTTRLDKGFFLIFSLIVFDLFTKALAFGQHFSIFNFLDVNYTTNVGSAFGILSGFVYANSVFILLSVFVLGLLFYYFQNKPKYKLGLIFIIAGTVANLVDRIVHGHVVDFIDFKIWPVFNFADVFIFVGVVLVVYKIVKS